MFCFLHCDLRLRELEVVRLELAALPHEELLKGRSHYDPDSMSDRVAEVTLDLRLVHLVRLRAVHELDERRDSLGLADDLPRGVLTRIGLRNVVGFHLEPDLVLDVLGKVILGETLLGIAHDIELLDEVDINVAFKRLHMPRNLADDDLPRILPEVLRNKLRLDAVLGSNPLLDGCELLRIPDRYAYVLDHLRCLVRHLLSLTHRKLTGCGTCGHHFVY